MFRFYRANEVSVHSPADTVLLRHLRTRGSVLCFSLERREKPEICTRLGDNHLHPATQWELTDGWAEEGGGSCLADAEKR